MKQRLLLLPGMDGTGSLFADFVKAISDTFETEIVSYPPDVCLTYSELMHLVRKSIPKSEQFVLVAESFSTPLAIQYAAMNPPNLKGLVLCAGFATSPVHGWLRFIGSFLAPILFGVAIPKSVTKLLLVGSTAPPSLLTAVQAAVSSVQPKVLLARFRAVLDCDALAELTQVAIPILYLRATQDRLVPASCLEEILRIKPQTVAAGIDGPHLLFQREPLQIAEVVARFVQQIL
ncbi:MAG: alpha/beta hydrolase [Terracidiphilus sp.]|jgi:pimeloyl-ACP methyl ester carboxylesterase